MDVIPQEYRTVRSDVNRRSRGPAGDDHSEQQGTHVAASVGLASVVSPSEPPLHLNELGTCARRWRGGNFTAADYRPRAHRRATGGVGAV